MRSQRSDMTEQLNKTKKYLNISINVLNQVLKSSRILKIAAFISTRKKRYPLATLTQIIW